jgi:GWxTD domain-containing protein
VKKPSFKNLKLLPRTQTRRVSQLGICRFTPRLFLGILILFFLLAYHFSLQAQSHDRVDISSETYLQRLQIAGAETLRNEYETDFVILLEKREQKAYQALSLPQRRDYITLYWQQRDPDPFTPANERLEEHLERRAHVRENFYTDKPPYFDDRGKIYLKYGRPKFRYVDPGGVNMAINQDLSLLVPDGGFVGEQAIFDSSGIRRISQTNPPLPWQKTAAMLPPGSVAVLPNETWSYDQIQSGLVFNFVRQGQLFKQTPDLRHAINGGRMQHRMLQTATLYLQRQTISPAYFELARELETVGQEMRSPTGGVSSQRLEDKIYRAVTETASDLKQAMREAPPEAFIHKVNTAELPFVADVVQFRGEHDQTRVVIGFGVNLGENGLTMDSAGNDVTYGYFVSNQYGETVARADHKKNIPFTAEGAASVLGSVGVMEFSCEPAIYTLALQAATDNGRHRSMSRIPLAARDFRGSDLMISDIQFYLPIAPPAEAAFEVAAAKTVAYPFAAVLKSIPLAIHFEIYNLAAIGLGKNYRIDYSVTEQKTGGNLLSKLANSFGKTEEGSITLVERRTATQAMVRESLTLSLEKLRPGSYQLEITVQAEEDAAILAKTSRQFVLAGEK